MTTFKLAASLLGGASALAIASAAYAQTAPAAPAPAGEIVVTGSRVITNGNNSPTPVTVVSSDQLLQLQPTTINDALNDLPAFQGSRGQFSTPNTTSIYGGGNPATDELNLRNLAPQRTLVLFDGQRVAPTNALGVVDVDMIPQELIQRVDINTGGGSAVYGSDAIAGVVNYITDTKFNGFKANANYGQSNFNDDQSWSAGFAAGTKFADDKGHIEVSFNHYDDKGIPNRYDRGYYGCLMEGATPNSTAAAGSVANPYGEFCNVRNSQNTYGGLITSGSLSGQTFDSNGVLEPFANGSPTGTANMQVGGDGTLTRAYETLKAPEDFNQAFVRLDYDLLETVHFHTEAAFNSKLDTSYSEPAAENNYTYSTANPFLPAVYAAAMGSATTFKMSKIINEIPLTQQNSNVQNIFVNTGFDGRMFDKYNWGVDFNYGNNVIHDAFLNNVNSQKLAAALDPVTVTTANVGSSGLPIGSTACYAALTNSAYSNCVPFNAFGPTAASAAAMAYVTQTTHYTPQFGQIELSGHITGDLFNLPAGPVVTALSAEYRKLSFSVASDASPLQLENCTGLRYNCSATTQVWTDSFQSSPTVSQSVKEGAIEIDAPLLRNIPFIQSLSFNGALRYTSYDYGGNNWTYKLGLVWHISDEYEIRFSQTQDIEAPALGMLFLPEQVTTFTGDLDVLTNITGPGTEYNIGNPNLVSEVGHTTTVGFVWRPLFLPGASLSVDAYHTIVDGALVELQGQAAATQQVCDASGGTSPYCALIVRPLPYSNTTAANQATAYKAEFINSSTIETYGADIEANYARRVFDRPFSLRVLANWQPHYLYSAPGSPTYDFGGVDYPNLVPLQDVPAFQLTGIVQYGLTDNFFVTVTERYRSAMALEPGGAYADVITPGPGAYATTNLNLSYHLGKTGSEVYLDIRDLFNVLPQALPGVGNNAGYAASDDPDGRYITVGFRFKY